MPPYTKVAPEGTGQFKLNNTNFGKINDAVYELKGRIFDPEEYGSVGGSDDSSAVSAAAAAANAAGGGIVPVRLLHNVTHTVVVPSNVILRSTAWGAGFSSSSGITMLQLRDDVTGVVEGAGLENLRLTGINLANGATGIQWAYYASGAPVRSARTNYMSGCWIGNCNQGLRLVNDQGIRVSSCRFESNAIGAKAADNAELGQWDSCDFRYNSTAGIVLENTNAILTPAAAEGVYGHQFNRCHWESNTGKGVVLDGAGSNTFVACKWEANDGTSVDQVTTNAATRPDGNAFVNCIWNGNTGTPTAKHFNLDKGRMTSFIGGSFNPASTGGVVISANAIDTFLLHTLLDPSILSDSSGSTWAITPGFGQVRIPFAPNHLSGWMTNTGGTVSIGTLPPFINVTNVRIQVTTAFDGATPKISVGTAGNNTLFCTATDISTTGIKAPVLNVMGYYDATIQPTNIYYTGGASTVGRAIAILEYETVANRP